MQHPHLAAPSQDGSTSYFNVFLRVADSGYLDPEPWLRTFLGVASVSLHAVTHHVYPGVDANNFNDPAVLDTVLQDIAQKTCGVSVGLCEPVGAFAWNAAGEKLAFMLGTGALWFAFVVYVVERKARRLAAKGGQGGARVELLRVDETGLIIAEELTPALLKGQR